MTLSRDLVLSEQQVASQEFKSTQQTNFNRPQFIFNQPQRVPPLYFSTSSDFSLSPTSPIQDFLQMGDSPQPYSPQQVPYTLDYQVTVKTEPVDNSCPSYSDVSFHTSPVVTIASDVLLNESINCNNSSLNSVGIITSSNNNPGDATTPTDHAMSLTELDQLLNSDLTFYEELQNSGLIKREPLDPMPVALESTQSRMDYDSDESQDSDCSEVICGESFSEVRSEIVRQVKNDIRMATSVLDLPQDPRVWTTENVQNWIRWTMKHYNLGIVESLDAFRMTGLEFSSMGEADFNLRSPQYGSSLYAQLDMWQNAASLEEPTPTQSPTTKSPVSPTLPTIPQPNPLYLPTNQRKVFQQLSPKQEDTTSNSSGACALNSDAFLAHRDTPDPLSPTDSSVDSKSFGSSVSSCGSDDECEPTGRQTIHLWQFLKMLLLQPQFYGNCIRWLDRKNGIFKIEDSTRVAKLWGKRKNRPAMNYDKLSRSIRQYYKKGIIKKTENSKRLVYQFCHPYLL